MADILFLFSKQFWSAFVYLRKFSVSCYQISKKSCLRVQKGKGRRRMILSQGGAIRRGRGPPLVRTLWSCLVLPRILHLPKVPPSLDPLHPVLGGGAEPKPVPPTNTVTWASSPNKWRQPLPANHRKRLYFLHKGSQGFGKHLSSVLHKVTMCISTMGVRMVSAISAHAFLVSDNWYLISDQNLSSSGVSLWLVYFEVGWCVSS